MTTTYDPAEVERLEREAREDDSRMTRAPWFNDSESPTSGFRYVHVGDDSGPGQTVAQWMLPADACGIARTRNNLRDMADQLEAAQARIAELETVARAYVDQRQQLDAARSEVARMTPVVEAALVAETARANLHQDKSTLNWTAKCEADAALAAALAKVRR